MKPYISPNITLMDLESEPIAAVLSAGDESIIDNGGADIF